MRSTNSGLGMGEAQHELTPTMIVVRFKKTFPLRIAEWLAAFVMAHWGLLALVNPGIMSRSSNWHQMLDMMPERSWGVIVLGAGLIRLAALTINGAWRHSPHLRAICAFLAVFVWLQITFALLTNDVTTFAFAVYPWFLLLDMWNTGRAANDARIADDRARGVVTGIE